MKRTQALILYWVIFLLFIPVMDLHAQTLQDRGNFAEGNYFSDRVIPRWVCEETLVNRVIGFGTVYSDTIVVYSSNPMLFYNDKYSFESPAEVVDAFPDAEVWAKVDYYDPPMEVPVCTKYGDSLMYQIMPCVGTLTKLDGGTIVTNKNLVISKHFKIGSTLDEVSKFLGFDRLDLTLPKINYRTIFISCNHLKIKGTKYENPGPYFHMNNADFWCITVEMVNDRIVSISFGNVMDLP